VRHSINEEDAEGGNIIFMLKRIGTKSIVNSRCFINFKLKSLILLSVISIVLLSLSGCGGSESSGSSGIAQENTTDGTTTAGTGSVTLNWNAPATNSNGSTLTDLAGYKVYYGLGSGQQNRTKSVNVGNYTSASVSGLSTGDWCFAVTAYDTSGNESTPSPEVCKII